MRPWTSSAVRTGFQEEVSCGGTSQVLVGGPSGEEGPIFHLCTHFVRHSLASGSALRPEPRCGRVARRTARRSARSSGSGTACSPGWWVLTRPAAGGAAQGGGPRSALHPPALCRMSQGGTWSVSVGWRTAARGPESSPRGLEQHPGWPAGRPLSARPWEGSDCRRGGARGVGVLGTVDDGE